MPKLPRILGAEASRSLGLSKFASAAVTLFSSEQMQMACGGVLFRFILN